MSHEFHECVTCGERVNTLEGFNCVRCASGDPKVPGGGAVQGNVTPGTEHLRENAALAAKAIMAIHWGSCLPKDATILGQAYNICAKLSMEGYPK